MKSIVILSALLACALPLSAAEKDGQAVAAKYNCLGCHSVDHKIVGPAFRDVAIRYRDQPDAEAQLMNKVKKGTGGNWGTIIKMPAQQIKDGDLKVIIHWVLSQK